MTMKTMKLAMAAAAVIGAGAAFAQEFGTAPSTNDAAAEFVQQPNGAMAQDQAQAEAAAPVQQAATKPEDALAAYMNDPKNGILPYDAKTGRIVVQSTVTFDVRNPEVSNGFIEERNARATELLLNAKAEIVKSICSKMSAERLLDLPANPIRKQLDKEEAEIRKHVEYVKKQLDEAGIALNDAKLDTKTLSAPELMAAVAQVYKGDYAANLDAEKKAKLEAAKNDYKNLKAEYEALVKKAELVQSQFQDSVSKTSKASISLSAEMQIHGCSILEQSEGAFIQNGKWKYQISAIFSWSQEAQKAAEAILDARPVKFVKGKRSVIDWLGKLKANGALADWTGPRTYIDDKGDMWYLGICAAPAYDDSIDDEKAQKSAALRARAEVGYALYSQLVTTNALNELSIDLKVDGATVSKQLSDYNEKTIEGFKNLTIFGLGKVGPTHNLRHASGHDIHVVIYGVNASNAKSMRDIQAAAHKLGIAINTKQEIERSRQVQMRQLTEMSRDNAAARRIGAQQALRETADAFAPQPAPLPQPPPPGAAPQQPAGFRPGVRFIKSTDDF